MATFKVLDLVTRDYQRDANGHPRLVTVGSPAYMSLLSLGFEPTAFGLMVPRFIPAIIPDLTQEEKRHGEELSYNILAEQGLVTPLRHSPNPAEDVWEVVTPHALSRRNLEQAIGNRPHMRYAFFVEVRRLAHPEPEPIPEPVAALHLPGDNIRGGAYGPEILNQPVIRRTPYVFTNADLERFTPDRTLAAYTPDNVRLYYDKTIWGRYDVDGRVYLVLYKDTHNPQRFTLFTDEATNCAMNIIKNHPKCRNKQKAFKAVLAEVIEAGIGFTQEHANLVQSKLLLRIVVKNQIDTWYDSDPTGKQKRPIITIFGNENHATTYKQLEPPTKVVYVSEQELRNKSSWIPGNKEVYGYPKMIKQKPGFQPTGYRTSDTVVKVFKPRIEEDNAEYFQCASELAFEYKYWKLSNNLRPASADYYELIRAADHHLGTQQFSEITDAEVPGYDMNKAYPSFKESPYYAQYKIPTGGYCAYMCEDDKSVLEKTGFSIICDIVYHSELIEKTGWIQENCIYSNMRLKFLLDNKLASFTVIGTITAIGEDLVFPFKHTAPADECLDENALRDLKAAKTFNVSFVGRLIAGASKKTIKNTYSSSFAHEREQIIFNAKALPDYVNHTEDGDYITIETSAKNKQSCLHGIHAYILDYQQITFMQTMLKTPLENIITFHTDGFYTKVRIDEAVIPHSLKPHEFKHFAQQVPWDSTFDFLAHSPIEEINFTDSTVHADTQFNLIYGPPGCGKSSAYFDSPIYGACMLTPTHVLKYNHKQRTEMYCATLHKFFCIGSKRKFRVDYENVIVDEITMVPRQIVTRIIELCKKYRINLFLVGDIDEKGIHQMSPPAKFGLPIQWGDFDEFTKLRRVSKTRQGVEDTAFLNTLRGMHPRNQLRLLRSNPKIHFVTNIDEYDANSTGIVSIHARGNALNKEAIMMSEATDHEDLPYVVRAIKHVRADIPKGTVLPIPFPKLTSIWTGRMSAEDKAPKEDDFEPGFFNTADAIQGQTITGKLFIDLTSYTRDNYLYVAVTRCTDLANVYFIEDLLDTILEDPAIAEIKETYEPITIMEEEKPSQVIIAPLTETKVIPREYIRKVDYEAANEEGFIINCELPYRKFLAFDSHADFANWQTAQPMHMRSYHEVNNTLMRRLMVDIDGANVPRAEWAQFGNECVGKFVAVFNKYYADKAVILPTDVNDELAIIDASGYSAQKKADKFSLQIRTVSYVTSIYDAAKFAASFAQTLTRPETVDLGIYSPYRCMRIVGSTKKDDQRHSRCVYPIDLENTFLSTNIDWCTRLSAEITSKPKATQAQIPNEIVQKIVAHAEQYTAGSNFHSCVGNELRYRRMEPSHCHCCNRVHAEENIVIKVKHNAVFLGCYRDKSITVEITPEDFDIPDVLENVNPAHIDAGFTDM